jgi:hypothetical protein
MIKTLALPKFDNSLTFLGVFTLALTLLALPSLPAQALVKPPSVPAPCRTTSPVTTNYHVQTDVVDSRPSLPNFHHTILSKDNLGDVFYTNATNKITAVRANCATQTWLTESDMQTGVVHTRNGKDIYVNYFIPNGWPTVGKLTPEGKLPAVHDSTGENTTSQFFKVGPDNHTFYIAERGYSFGNTIKIYDSTTQQNLDVVPHAPHQNYNVMPGGIEVDSVGNTYLTYDTWDQTTHTNTPYLQRVSSSGEAVSRYNLRADNLPAGMVSLAKDLYLYETAQSSTLYFKQTYYQNPADGYPESINIIKEMQVWPTQTSPKEIWRYSSPNNYTSFLGPDKFGNLHVTTYPGTGATIYAEMILPRTGKSVRSYAIPVIDQKGNAFTNLIVDAYGNYHVNYLSGDYNTLTTIRYAFIPN